jgi:hypothetical protein
MELAGREFERSLRKRYLGMRGEEDRVGDMRIKDEIRQHKNPTFSRGENGVPDLILDLITRILRMTEGERKIKRVNETSTSAKQGPNYEGSTKLQVHATSVISGHGLTRTIWQAVR